MGSKLLWPAALCLKELSQESNGGMSRAVWVAAAACVPCLALPGGPQASLQNKHGVPRRQGDKCNHCLAECQAMGLAWHCVRNVTRFVPNPASNQQDGVTIPFYR